MHCGWDMSASWSGISHFGKEKRERSRKRDLTIWEHRRMIGKNYYFYDNDWKNLYFIFGLNEHILYGNTIIMLLIHASSPRASSSRASCDSSVEIFGFKELSSSLLNDATFT